MKLTKKQNELLEFIEQQTSLSLHDFVVNKSTTTKCITIVIDDLDINELMLIEGLSKMSGKYKIEMNGSKLAIMLT